MAKTNSEKWEEYLNGTTPSTEVSKEEGHRRLQEYRAQKAAANPAPVSGDKTAAPVYMGAGRLPDISGNPAAGNLPFQRIGNTLTDTQKAQMVPTIMLNQKQQELEDYKASDAYRTDSEAQAQKDRNQAAAAQASQSDNMGSYLASAIMDLFGTTSAPSTGKTEREKELEAEIEYYSQKQQEAKDYGIMEKDLAEYRTWDSSDQQLLNRYIQGRVGSWSDIVSGISSAMTGGYRSGDAQYNAAQALQTLSEKYGEARVKEIAESVERYQNAQNAQYMESLGRDSATFGGNLMSVGASLGGSITAPIGALQSLTGSTGRFSTLDPNNPGYLPNTFSGAVRGQTKEDIQEAFNGNFAGKAVSAIYESGMSALDNMLRIAVGGEVGSLALAATGSFGQTVQKVSAQGGTPAQALAMGVIDGALEVITEKVSLDNLLSQKNTGWQGFRKAIKDAFIAGGIEVSEEELSFVASTLAEAAVLRDKSSYKQTIAELVAGGMSYEDAKAQADRQLVNEALNTALNSFLSGNMMSGATSTVQGVTNVAENLLDLQGAGDYSSFFTPPNVARDAGPDVQQNTAQGTAMPTGRPESTAAEHFTPSAESPAVGQQTARETAQEAPRNVSRNVEAQQEQQTGQTREADMAQAFREAAAELQGVPTPETQGETAGTATENGPENADTSETEDSADRPGEWSVGAANSGFTGKEAYYELIGEDNYQPDRPGDVRGGEVAKVDPYGRNVTKFAKNAHGAAVTSDAMADAIEDLIMDGALGFDRQTSREALKRAKPAVSKARKETTRNQLIKNVANGVVKDGDIEKAMLLYADYNRSGDIENASEMMVSLSMMANMSGRRLNLFKLLRRMTPEGQLMTVEKTVRSQIDKLNKRRSDKNQIQDISIPQELQEQYLEIAKRSLDNNELVADNEEQRKDVEQAIYSFAASQIKATFAEKWNAWRYMCMLGNVRTNVRNLAGNAAYIPYTEAKRAIGTAIEKAFLPKDQRTKSLIGFGENDRAILKWANADAKTTAAEALKYTARLGDDNAKSKIQDSRKIFDTKLLESARKVIEWAPSAGDIIFKNREYSLSLAGFLKARGYTYSDITENKVSESVLYEARNYAIQEAMRATFNDVNAISEFFTNIRAPKNNPIGQAVNLILEGVLPFRKTPANIIARSLENTPFNAFRGGINLLTKVKKGEMTAATAIDQIASGMTGTAAWALGYALASGILPVRLVGYVDDEEEKRRGAQSYALTWTDSEGNDHYVDISWAAPANIPLFVGANLYQIRDGQGMDTSVSKMTGFLYSSMTLFEPMLELSCLSSLNDLVESVRYSNSGDAIYTVLAQAATSYFTQGIPTLLRQADQATQKNEMQTFANSSDPLIRSAQRTAANIPFAGRAFKTEKIDEFGNPVSRGNVGQRVLDAFVSPGKHTVVDNTDVTAEIDRLNELGSSVSPPDIQKTITFTDSEGVIHANQRLTEQEYARLRQLQGQTADTVLNQMISSPDYAALSDAQKEKAFDYAYDYARETARTQAIEGYSGMDGWMEKIEGKEADTIIQKVVIGDLTGAAKSLKSVWADNKDDSSALMDLEDIYQSYTRMEESTRDAVLEEVSGAAQDYIRFRNDGGTAERYSTIYRPYVLADSAVTDARAAFRAGEAVGEDVSEALSQAYERYSGMNFTDKKAFKEIASTVVNGFMEAGAAGMNADTFVDLYRQYYTISNGEGKASEKASSWASVLRRAVENGTIEEKQETIMKNRFKIATGFTVEATRFDAMTDAGLSADKSDYVMELLTGIEPEEGRTNIRDVQYAEQISGSNRLSESEKAAALSAYLSDSQKENLSEMQKLGYDTEDYANAYRIYLDYASGKGKKAATIKHLQSVFGIDYQTAKAIYEIFG